MEKTMAAPVTVIVAYDTEFYEKLPQLFPHTDARSWFVDKPELIQSTAFRNGRLPDCAERAGRRAGRAIRRYPQPPRTSQKEEDHGKASGCAEGTL